MNRPPTNTFHNYKQTGYLTQYWAWRWKCSGTTDSPKLGELHAMDHRQAKWFLQMFAAGKELDSPTVQELYLSGYLDIDLYSPANHPVPTGITEKGKHLLKSGWEPGAITGLAIKCLFGAA